MIKRFFPEYFLVAIPIGLMRVVEKGYLSNGPIMNPFVISSSSKVSTTSGSFKADCRFLQRNYIFGNQVSPAKNP